MLKKILILIGFLGIFLPAICFATNDVSVTPDGQVVTIKIDNVSQGIDLDKDVVVTSPNGQRVSMTATNTNGVLSIIGTDNPGLPGAYTYIVAVDGKNTTKTVTTTATPPTNSNANTNSATGRTILPVGKDPAQWDLSDINALIANVGNLMLSIASGVAIIYIIIGAYHYFFAFGSEETATTAKKTITYAIAGLVIIILAKVILTTVWNFMSPTPINFLF